MIVSTALVSLQPLSIDQQKPDDNRAVTTRLTNANLETTEMNVGKAKQKRTATQIRSRRKRKAPVQVVDSIVREKDVDNADSIGKKAKTTLRGAASVPSDGAQIDARQDAPQHSKASLNESVGSVRASQQSANSVARSPKARDAREQSDLPVTRSVLNLSSGVNANSSGAPSQVVGGGTDAPESGRKNDGLSRLAGQLNTPLVRSTVPDVVDFGTEKRIMLFLDQFTSKLYQTIDKRLGCFEAVVNDVREDVKVCKELLSTIDVKPSKSGKKRSRSIEFFPFLFHRKLMQYVTEACVTGRIYKIIAEVSECSYLQKISLAVQAIMFAKRPETPKVQYSSKVGFQYCKLRRSMVRTALSLVQEDRYGKFCSDGSSSETKHGNDVKSNKVIVRPFLCTPNFIRKKHLDVIQSKLEIKGNQANGQRNSMNDENEELALEVATKLFSSVTSLLTRARERCKKTLYECIGFLFSNWASFGVTLNQTNTEFVWNVENCDTYFDRSMPNAKVMEVNSGQSTECHKENMEIWKQILDNNKDFILLVSYEVSIKAGKAVGADSVGNVYKEEDHSTMQTDGASSSDSTVNPKDSCSNLNGLEVRRIYRAFNLLDTAAQFLSSYCGGRANDVVYDLFGSSKDSFRSVYGLACLLKHWMSNLVDDFNATGPSAFIPDYEVQTERLIDGLGLYNMFPGQSRMRSTLANICLCLSPEEFNDDCLEEQHRTRFPRYRTNEEAHSDENSNETPESNNISDDDTEKGDHNEFALRSHDPDPDTTSYVNSGIGSYFDDEEEEEEEDDFTKL